MRSHSRRKYTKFVLATLALLWTADGLAKRPASRGPSDDVSGLELLPGPPELAEDEIGDVDLSAAWERERRTAWTNPGTTATTPTGFGADWGTFFGGLGLATRREVGDAADASLAAGFGLGNALKYVGFEVALVLTDLDNIGEDMNFSLKLHRYLGSGFGLALGTVNDLKIGEDTFETPSRYLVASKIFRLRDNEMHFLSSLGIHLGVGTGQFRSNDDFVNNRNTVGPFGALGARLWAPLGVAASWSGDDVDIGINFAPFRSFRFVCSATVTDTLGLTGRRNTYLLSVSWGDSVFEPTFPLSGSSR